MSLRNKQTLDKWRAISFTLSILSILANLEWVTLPFSFYGLRGRSGVLYGEYTLLQTFHFHYSGIFWWLIIGLQVFSALIVGMNLSTLRAESKIVLFLLPAIMLLLLDIYVMQRWNAPVLWTMYAIGVVPALILIASGLCYTKSH